MKRFLKERETDALLAKSSVDTEVDGCPSDESIKELPVGETANMSAETSDSHCALPMALPVWKRLLDLTLIFLTCVVWLPLMLLLMALVKCSSPGPVFYRQERVGLGGRPFMIFKFRSMKVTAETECHERHFERLMHTNVPMTKLDVAGDPRIVPWGKIMRATGLDELPQLFNVIEGNMSLVGPRPCTVQEFSRYQPWQRERVNITPGLTGYWQVNGKNATTFSEMIDMDILYGKKMSVWFDLIIILRTLPALINQVVTLPRKRRRITPQRFSQGLVPSAQSKQ